MNALEIIVPPPPHIVVLEDQPVNSMLLNFHLKKRFPDSTLDIQVASNVADFGSILEELNPDKPVMTFIDGTTPLSPGQSETIAHPAALHLIDTLLQTKRNIRVVVSPFSADAEVTKKIREGVKSVGYKYNHQVKRIICLFSVGKPVQVTGINNLFQDPRYTEFFQA